MTTGYYGSSSVGSDGGGSSEVMSVLVVGKAGNGKSSLCNAVLGEERFTVGRGMAATTVTAQSETTVRGNMRLKVVDTPDVTNCNMDAKTRKQEVVKWRQLTTRPSVVLLAVRCDVRYTAEESAIYREILDLWGDNSLKECLVVAFTFGDRQDNDLEEELQTVCPELKSVLGDADKQYVLFDKTNEQCRNGIVYDIVNAVEKRKTRSPAGRGTSEDYPSQPRPLGSLVSSRTVTMVCVVLLVIAVILTSVFSIRGNLGAAFASGVIGFILVIVLVLMCSGICCQGGAGGRGGV